jgi:uncharacterized protein (DUF1697 family)
VPRVKARVALLRGINVGGHNKIPMAELRQVAGELGWQDVRTYIQSGNLVFRGEGAASSLEQALSDAIQSHFGLQVPVIVRSGAEWASYVKANPLLDMCRKEPQLVMLALSRKKPSKDAVTGLVEYAQGGEKVLRTGDALWVHFANGSARSKLTPSVLDRLVGSPVTTRNWRSVLKLGEMLGD